MLLSSGFAFLAALTSAPAASAASRDHGASFAVRCDFTHRNSDDPIVHPGQQGAAHSHDFFGNRSTKFDSTYESMLAAPTSTSCTRPEDTAGYWFPTVRWTDQNGTTAELQAHRAVFYYRAGGKDHTRVKPFGADLRVINASRITWSCGTKDAAAGTKTPPTQCGGGVLGLRIIFPDCSNGRTDSADHRSHMARSVLKSDGKRRCPSTHPVPVPTSTVNANFAIPTTKGEVTLLSGVPPRCTPTSGTPGTSRPSSSAASTACRLRSRAPKSAGPRPHRLRKPPPCMGKICRRRRKEVPLLDLIHRSAWKGRSPNFGHPDAPT